MDRLKKRFAWDNDEYDIVEDDTPHADIPANFPGISLDTNDDVEPVSKLYEETAEEEVRRVSQTTGVPAHGALTTGVQGDGFQDFANIDPAQVFVIQPDNHDEGVDDEDVADALLPEEDLNEDSDLETTTPEILQALDNEENPDEEINGVLADTDVTQGEEVTPPAVEGIRRSSRERRKPTAYEPSHNNKAYTYQGVININVLEEPNMRKFTEIDQAYHVIDVALVEAHSLKRD